MDLSADRILTHRKHRADEGYVAPAKTRRDFATLVQERAAEQFEAGELDLANKEHAAGIGAGLKAQAIIDKRELAQKKHTQAEALVALLAALRGEGHGPVALIEDGMTIEGEAHEVD